MTRSQVLIMLYKKCPVKYVLGCFFSCTKLFLLLYFCIITYPGCHLKFWKVVGLSKEELRFPMYFLPSGLCPGPFYTCPSGSNL